MEHRKLTLVTLFLATLLLALANTAAWPSIIITIPTSGIIGSSTPRTFGKTTVGALSAASGSNVLHAERKELLEDGNVTSLTIYVGSPITTSKLKMAIYADSSGVPGALLAVTEEKVVVAGFEGWLTFNLLTPTPLTAGFYWLSWWDESGKDYWRDFVPITGNMLYRRVTYDTFPDPFGTPDDWLDNEEHSLYGTYTPAGAIDP